MQSSQTRQCTRFSYFGLCAIGIARSYHINSTRYIRISSLAGVLSCTKSLADLCGISKSSKERFLAVAKSLAGSELSASSALSLAHLCGISESSQKLVARAKSLAGGELSTSGALSLAHLCRISKSSQEFLLAVTKSLAGSECLSRKFLALSHLRGISKTRNELLLLGAKSLARGELSATGGFALAKLGRIAQTSRGLLGKDGTGGDGATEKLGDVGEGGATVRRAGIEGGSRIGTQEGGRRQNGSGEDEAGHGWGWFSVMHYNLQ